MNKPEWEGRPIKDLLEEKLTIPPYQRGYAWEEDEVDDFLEDFFKHMKSNNEYYLFGQIIIHKHKESDERGSKIIYDIIDGQQRMATSVMFLSVLRDALKKIADSCDRGTEEGNELYETIEEFIVDNFNKKSIGEVKKKDGPAFNLTLSGVNEKYFMEHVQKKVDLSQSKVYEEPSNKKIRKACSKISDRITKELALCGNDIEEQFNKIEDFFRHFTEEFYVCKITTEDVGQAYVIFETINSRGKDLEAADLLKNYFLAKKPGKELAEKWVDMVNRIMPSGKPTQFIRYYWNSKYEFVREKDLFNEVKNKTTKQREVDKFLNELFDSADVYLFLRSPEDNRSMFELDDIVDRISLLKQIGAQSFYPLIISAKRNNIKDPQILKMIKGIESLIVRNITFGGENPNQYERFFNELSFKLQNGESTVDDIIQSITKRTLDDSVFAERFKQYESKGDKSFIILKRLYSSEYELEIKNSRKTVNVEHIMPVDPKEWDLSYEPEQLAEWDCKTPKEVHSKYLNRLGNQTLLSDKINKSISNKVFEVKINEYEKSKIEENLRIAKKTYGEEWTPASIIERQEHLCDIALKEWPRG